MFIDCKKWRVSGSVMTSPRDLMNFALPRYGCRGLLGIKERAVSKPDGRSQFMKCLNSLGITRMAYSVNCL